MLILDLKTVPDPAAAKRLLALESFADAEAVLAMTTLRVARQQPASPPPQLRRIVAATLIVAEAGCFDLVEFDDADGESALLAGLESAASRRAGPVCAWDAAAQYRSQLLARTLATTLALPVLLAERGPRSLAAHFGFAPGTAFLPELAAVHALPQQLGLRAADAEAAHAAGDCERLRAGSSADALIAWLLTLALQQATGERPAAAVAVDRAAVRDWLSRQATPAARAFLNGWKS